MNLQPNEIDTAIISQQASIADAIELALKSAERHYRKASVVVTFTAARDKNASHILVLKSVIKVKTPKGARVDVTTTSETEELLRIDTGETDGQQKIGEE